MGENSKEGVESRSGAGDRIHLLHRPVTRRASMPLRFDSLELNDDVSTLAMTCHRATSNINHTDWVRWGCLRTSVTILVECEQRGLGLTVIAIMRPSIYTGCDEIGIESHIILRYHRTGPRLTAIHHSDATILILHMRCTDDTR
jgi:hypothetical protein